MTPSRVWVDRGDHLEIVDYDTPREAVAFMQGEPWAYKIAMLDCVACECVPGRPCPPCIRDWQATIPAREERVAARRQQSMFGGTGRGTGRPE